MEGRRLASSQDSVDASIQRLEDYLQKRWRRLIAAARNNTNETRSRETKNKNKTENKSGKKNNSMDALID